MLSKIEIENLRSAKSETEWNNICSVIKQKYGGKYPPDWHDKIVLSGILNNSIKKWKENKKSQIGHKLLWIFGVMVSLVIGLIILVLILASFERRRSCVYVGNGVYVCRDQ